MAGTFTLKQTATGSALQSGDILQYATPTSSASLPPDGILTQTLFTGALSDIIDSPDSPDANWMLGGVGTNILRVSFPTPAGNLRANGNNQTFRIRVRPGT
jgi:hypothetical protein